MADMEPADRTVDRAWDRIEAWLAVHVPSAYASLLPPAAPEAISAAAARTGLTLPDGLIASLRRHNGCATMPGKFSLLGQNLMSADGLADHWESWQEARRFRSHAGEGASAALYWPPGYAFFAAIDADGLVVDCRPGPAYGAVGEFWKEEGARFGDWSSVGDLLTEVADALERRTRVSGWVPVARENALDWVLPQDQHPDPASLLELAAGARVPAVPDLPHRYDAPVPEAGWVDEYQGFCLTFVRGVGPAELLARYGAQPVPAAPGTARRTARETWEAVHTWTNAYLPAVRVGRFGDWAFGFEEGSQQGSRPEVLRRLSAGTRAVAVHHSDHTRLSVVDDGELITTYDTRQPDHRTGSAPDLLLTALRDARLVPLDDTRYEDEDVYALLGVLTDSEGGLGIEWDARALRGPLPCAHLLPVLADPPTDGRFNPFLEPMTAARVSCAPEPRLRTAVTAQAVRLAAETGLDRCPEVADAIRRFAAGESRHVTDDSPLGMRIRTLEAEALAAARSRSDPAAKDLLTASERDAWARRSGAAHAVRGLACVPLRAAAYEVLARRLGLDWRAEFRSDLGPV